MPQLFFLVFHIADGELAPVESELGSMGACKRQSAPESRCCVRNAAPQQLQVRTYSSNRGGRPCGLATRRESVEAAVKFKRLNFEISGAHTPAASSSTGTSGDATQAPSSNLVCFGHKQAGMSATRTAPPRHRDTEHAGVPQREACRLHCTVQSMIIINTSLLALEIPPRT